MLSIVIQMLEGVRHDETGAGAAPKQFQQLKWERKTTCRWDSLGDSWPCGCGPFEELGITGTTTRKALSC